MLKIATLYGIGSFMAVLTVTAHWLLKEMLGGGLALLSAQPSLSSYYMPMVWGGIWAILFALPIRGMSWAFKGIVFGIAPALTFLALKSGGLYKVKEFLTPDQMLRHDTLLTLIVYVLVWGMGTSYVTQRLNVQS